MTPSLFRFVLHSHYNPEQVTTLLVVPGLICNVLRDYELTIDYEHDLSHWNQVSPMRTDDLHSVGISLIHTPTGYTVGGLVQASGQTPPVDIQVGDALVAINGMPAASMTRGAVLAALHGNPGDRRTLTLERSGKRFDVGVIVGSY